jgi:hypothetical protein
MKRLFYVLVSAFLVAGCAGQTTFTETKLIIPAKKTVRIAEVDLSITNEGCGRSWHAEKGQPGYEKPYCDLLIKRGDKTLKAGADFKPVYMGNLEIKVEKMNPWGREEDSIPPGGCRVWVKLLEGR